MLVDAAPRPMSTTLDCGDWSRRRLWIFRTGAALFGIQILASLGDTTNGARGAAASLRNAVRAVFAAVWPAGVDWVERLAARSDGHAVVLDLAGDVALAVVVAAVWTSLSRARHHDRLAGAMRVTLRYLVATVLLVYGGLKVIPVQFPVPSAEELLRPLGQRSPMALLWAFMGASPAYTVFGGFGEVLGGALLFWRRTTTLGALILTGVLANVVMLNFAYDVPVKRAASLLLLAALVLASRDAARLLRAFVLDGPAEPGGEAPFAAGPRLRKLRLVLKPTIVVLAIGGPIAAAIALGRPTAPKGPLDGVYAVERFVRDGADVAPLRTDPARWWRVVIGDRGGVVIENADGRCERFRAAVDERDHTLTLSAADGRSARRFHYEATAGSLRLEGDGDPIGEVVLRPLSAATVFRVLR